ncbi:MAG: hypothetical protein CBD58_03720 [bacterium TMED198]|nr:MAG: hypothetical protein CBD58_03720 [bacterium TMED198]|tara:strand:- start:451 stop:954 length:504 start_codon:yes stop_codon:yes gene_type:complete
MKKFIKESLYIVSISLFFGVIRFWILEDDFDLLKKERVAKEVACDDIPDQTFEPIQVSIECVKQMIKDNLATIIDSRDREEFVSGNIPGSINIPYNEIDEGLDDAIFDLEDLDRDDIYIVYCGGAELKCDISQYLSEEMIGSAFEFKRVLLYEGGWAEWSKEERNNE